MLALQDLQLKILEIVEAVSSSLDDVDHGVEDFTCRIGEPISEVVRDPERSILRKGTPSRPRYAFFFNALGPSFEP